MSPVTALDFSHSGNPGPNGGPEFSKEQNEAELKLQLQIAEMLVKEYVPAVREAVRDVADVICKRPGGHSGAKSSGITA